MKKIILIGEWYSSNLGDGVICNVVNKILSKKYEVIPFDISLRKYFENEISSTKKFWLQLNMERLASIKNKLLKKIGLSLKTHSLKQYFIQYKKNVDTLFQKKRPDAIVFAGGQMFSRAFIDRIEIIINIAKNYGVPVYFNACGYSKDVIKDIKLLKKLKRVLNSEIVKYISIRDGDQYIISLVRNKKILSTFDTALISSNYFSKITTPKYDIGVGIMYSPYTPIKKQIHFWDNFIREIKKKKVTWRVFVNGDVRDYEFAKILLKRNNINPDEYLLKSPETPDQLINIINLFNSIISMRLHSLIISYSYKIPFVGICWHEKIADFFKRIDSEQLISNFDDSYDDIMNKIYNSENEFYLSQKISVVINNNINNLIEIIENDLIKTNK